MSKLQLSFGLLQDCENRELVRLKHNGVTKWAIVSKMQKDASNLRIAILPGDKAPYLAIAADDMGIPTSDFRSPVLRYGTDYTITPDHAGPCDVGEGQIFGSKGSYILTDTETLLRLDDPTPKDRVAFLNVGTGALAREPKRGRAAFQKWTLWHDSPEDDPVALFEYFAKADV
jgi:hypothetical protein